MLFELGILVVLQIAKLDLAQPAKVLKSPPRLADEPLRHRGIVGLVFDYGQPQWRALPRAP